MLTAALVLLLQPTDARVQAELEAAGFEVKIADIAIDAAGDIPAQLWAACQVSGARVAVWFHPREGDAVDVWVGELARQKAMLRTEKRSLRAQTALHAVELVHEALIEVPTAPARIEEDAPPVPRFAPPAEKPHWVFGTGLGGVFIPLRGAQPAIEVQLGYQFRPSISLEVQVATSVLATAVQRRPQFPADVDAGVSFFRLIAGWTPVRAGSFSGGLLVGAGATLLWTTTGTAEKEDETKGAFMLSGGLIGSARLNEGVRLQLLAVVDAPLPQFGILGPVLIDAIVRLEFE